MQIANEHDIASTLATLPQSCSLSVRVGSPQVQPLRQPHVVELIPVPPPSPPPPPPSLAQVAAGFNPGLAPAAEQVRVYTVMLSHLFPSDKVRVWPMRALMTATSATGHRASHDARRLGAGSAS